MSASVFNALLFSLISLLCPKLGRAQTATAVGDLMAKDPTIIATTTGASLVFASTTPPIVQIPNAVASELSQRPGSPSADITPEQAKEASAIFGGISTTSLRPIEALAPDVLRKNRRDISRKSEDVIEGILDGYLHDQELLQGEKFCLRRLVGKVAGDVMSAGDDAVKAIKELLSKDKQSADIMSTVTDAGIKVTSIVTLAKTLVKECVKGDVLKTLNMSAQHLMNMTYVGKRLLANGVDISEALAESVIQWDKQDYREVGEQVGTALRKILLSKASKAPLLPEGMPRSEIISEVTSGLMSGFFVNGAELIIKDLAEPNVNIKIDLHRCIARNELFFQSVFKGLWTIIAQMATNREQFGHLFDIFNAKRTSRRLAPEAISDGMTELALAMGQIPSALRRCNIDDDTRSMLSDAIKSLQWARFKFDFPKEDFSEKEVQDLLARCVHAWTKFDFEDFGHYVGELLRAMVLKIYPQKYEVDKAGHLRRSLKDEVVEYNSKKQPFAVSTVTFVLSCATATLAAVFLAGRAIQFGAWRRYDTLSRRDVSRLDESRRAGSDEVWQSGLVIHADAALLEA